MYRSPADLRRVAPADDTAAAFSLCSQFSVPAAQCPEPLPKAAWEIAETVAGGPLPAVALDELEPASHPAEAVEAWLRTRTESEATESAARESEAKESAPDPVTDPAPPVDFDGLPEVCFTGGGWHRPACSDPGGRRRAAYRRGTYRTRGFSAALCAAEEPALRCLAEDAATVRIALGDLDLARGGLPGRCRRFDAAWPPSFPATKLGGKLPARGPRPLWPQSLAAKTAAACAEARRAVGVGPPQRRGPAEGRRPGSFPRLLLAGDPRLPRPRTAAGDARADAGSRRLLGDLRGAAVSGGIPAGTWATIAALYDDIGALHPPPPGEPAAVLDHGSLRRRAALRVRPMQPDASPTAAATVVGSPVEAAGDSMGGLAGIHMLASYACSAAAGGAGAGACGSAATEVVVAAALDAVVFAAWAVLDRVDDARPWVRLLDAVDVLSPMLTERASAGRQEPVDAAAGEGKGQQDAAAVGAPAGGATAAPSSSQDHGKGAAPNHEHERLKGVGQDEDDDQDQDQDQDEGEGDAGEDGSCSDASCSDGSEEGTVDRRWLHEAVARAIIGSESWAVYLGRRSIAGCVQRLTQRYPVRGKINETHYGGRAAMRALAAVGMVVGLSSCASVFVLLRPWPRGRRRHRAFCSATLWGAVTALMRVHLCSAPAGGSSSIFDAGTQQTRGTLAELARWGAGTCTYL